MNRQTMFFFLFFIPAHLTVVAQEPQLPSLDQITTLSSDLPVDEEQKTLEPEQETIPPQTANQLSWKQSLALYMQRLTLACVLKYYAIKAWIIRTT